MAKTYVFVEDKTKGINENIKMVLDAPMSKTAKRRTLIEVIGLTNTEANFFMKTLPVAPARPRTPRVPPFIFKFGVEIEHFSNQSKVMHLMSERNVNYQWSGRYYHNNGNSFFDFKHDGSITRDATIDYGNNGVECVSPVLNGDKNGLETLKGVCDILNETGAQVNKSTGMHIHISTPEMTDEWYINVFKNYQRLESLIDTFMAPSRRGDRNTYCGSLRCYDFNLCHTIEDVRWLMHNNRYHKVNPKSYSMHGTIEFRQHQGTTNYDKIAHWLAFCSKLIEWSKTNVLTADVTSIDNIAFLTTDEKVWFASRAESFAKRA